MNDTKKSPSKIDKKLLENPFVGSLVVPIAIVLVGALIVFGVTKMISSEHSYRDLVIEMKSKAFGNKWVAALELSKIISAKKIPPEEIPWLIENLSEIYTSTIDPRTKSFIVVAAGALADKRALNIFMKALSDGDSEIKFHALVALANMPKGFEFDWTLVETLLDSNDHALIQTAIFTLGTHGVTTAEEKILKNLNSDMGFGVRYAAATALISYKNEKCLPIIEEILALGNNEEEAKLTVDEIRGLKFNVLSSIQKADWTLLTASVERVTQGDRDVKVEALAKDVLKLLKK